MNPHVLLSLVPLFVFVTAPLSNEARNVDPYRTTLVRFELRVRSSPTRMLTSFGQKELPGLGDCVSIALIKITDEDNLSRPEVIRAALSMIERAFALPEFI